MSADVDAAFPGAWQEKKLYTLLKRLSAVQAQKNSQLLVFIGKRAIAVLPDRDVDLGDVNLAGNAIFYEKRTADPDASRSRSAPCRPRLDPVLCLVRPSFRLDLALDDHLFPFIDRAGDRNMRLAPVRSAAITPERSAPSSFARCICAAKIFAAADLTGASLVGAVLTGANLGADMKNQSMGLMRAVLKSANLDRAVLRDADLSRVDLEFASLRNADLTNASLRGAALGGANLTGASVAGADFDGADLASTRLVAPIQLDTPKKLDKAQVSSGCCVNEQLLARQRRSIMEIKRS